MTLLDQTATLAALWLTGSKVVVTVQMDTRFLSAARVGEMLEAKGALRQRTRSTLFLDAEICVDATAIMKMAPERDRESEMTIEKAPRPGPLSGIRVLDFSRILSGLIETLGYLSQIYFVTGRAPQPVWTKNPSIVPCGAFPTRDGHVIVACPTDGFWRAFANCLDMPDLIVDARFVEYSQRLENREALERLIEVRMRQEDTVFWLERLDAFDVPSAPILDVGEALAQPHVIAHGLAETIRHPKAVDMRVARGPVQFDGSPPAPSVPPPLLGEHSVEVLTGLLDTGDAECRGLIEAGVLGVPHARPAVEPVQ